MNNGNYSNNNHCKCGKLIGNYAKQCEHCYHLHNRGKNHCFYNKKRPELRGTNNPNYKDGRTLKKYYCIDCNKELNYDSVLYQNSKRCKSCSHKGKFNARFGLPSPIKGKKCPEHSKLLKKLWSSVEYKTKVVKKILKSNNLKPNKLEKLLINLFRKLNLFYKYVGNGKVILNGFNPDFINFREKKIIELFGDYWHNLPERRKIDRNRLKVYFKLDYQTLIVWEHELKNINRLIKKLVRFNKGV